jgi:hypothetical protein
MVKFKQNTQAIVRLAAEKSNQARRRVIEPINELQRESAAINFNTICTAARVSKTFLYDPKHIAKAQGESKIQSHAMTNDLGREAMTMVTRNTGGHPCSMPHYHVS